jgi:sporulation protein YlmC with PRC-barrel domain
MSDERSNETLPLNIGAEVHCPDGECGTLDKLVIHPRSHEVTDLIVKKGLLLKEDRVIPISAVAEATADRIELSVAADEFERYPEYDEDEYWAPRRLPSNQEELWSRSVIWMQPYQTASVLFRESVTPQEEIEDREGVDVDQSVMGGGTPVRNAAGEIGEVDHLLVDLDSGNITHLVVEKGVLEEDYVVIPYDVVQYMDDEGVFVDVDDDDLENLPRYTPPSS